MKAEKIVIGAILMFAIPMGVGKLIWDATPSNPSDFVAKGIFTSLVVEGVSLLGVIIYKRIFRDK